jgi:hypothetical protein
MVRRRKEERKEEKSRKKRGENGKWNKRGLRKLIVGQKGSGR